MQLSTRNCSSFIKGSWEAAGPDPCVVASAPGRPPRRAIGTSRSEHAVLRPAQVGPGRERQVARPGEDLLRHRHLDEVALGDLVVVVRDALVDLPEVVLRGHDLVPDAGLT